MPAKRAVAASGLALSLAAGSIGLVGVSPAAAGGKTVDACTAVPDSGPVFDGTASEGTASESKVSGSKVSESKVSESKVFDFTRPCLDHDTCYIEQPDGSTAGNRKRCDQQFRRAMMAWCDEHHHGRSQATRRRACKAVALLYYLGVRALGRLAWDQERPAEMA